MHGRLLSPIDDQTAGMHPAHVTQRHEQQMLALKADYFGLDRSGCQAWIDVTHISNRCERATAFNNQASNLLHRALGSDRFDILEPLYVLCEPMDSIHATRASRSRECWVRKRCSSSSNCASIRASMVPSLDSTRQPPRLTLVSPWTVSVLLSPGVCPGASLISVA